MISPDDECFEIIILFVVFSISIQFTQKQNRNPAANKTTEPYPDSQVISEQELRVHICSTLGINIADACISPYASCVFSLRCQVLALTIVAAGLLQFWQLRYKMLARAVNLSLWHCVNDNVVLKTLHPSSNCLYTKSKSTILRPLKDEDEYKLSTSKLSNSDLSSAGFSLLKCLSLSLMVLLNRLFFPSLHGWQCSCLPMFSCYIPPSNAFTFAFPSTFSTFSIERVDGMLLWNFWANDFQRALKIINIAELFIVITISPG